MTVVPERVTPAWPSVKTEYIGGARPRLASRSEQVVGSSLSDTSHLFSSRGL